MYYEGLTCILGLYNIFCLFGSVLENVSMGYGEKRKMKQQESKEE